MSEENNLENFGTVTESIPEKVPSWIPSKIPHRNEYGLVDDGSIEYIYTSEGLVDWRQMIPKKYFFPNRQNFESNGKQVPKSAEGLDDRDLVLSLPGVKYIANLRKFINVKHQILAPTNDFVINVCTIDWTGNFETSNQQVSFSGIGDASYMNATIKNKPYLAAFAENRAFVRAVRGFLRINIIGQDEIAPEATVQTSDPNTKMSTTILQAAMEKYNVSFEDIKKMLTKEKFDGIENLKTLNDIPNAAQFLLLELIKKNAQDI